MTIVKDQKIIDQLNGMRQQMMLGKNIQNELNAQRNKQLGIGEENEEEKGFGGILSDVRNKLVSGALGLPETIANAPAELYGAGKQIVSDPLRAAQNIGGGFGELGHSILSAPGNIRDYLQQKDLISNETPSFRLPESILPKDFNYSEALGVEGHEPGDELLQGIPKGIAGLPLANKTFSLIEELPLTKKIAAKPLVKAEKMIGERGVTNIPVDKKIFKEAKQFLPKTDEIKKLLHDAAKGDYEALFSLQSDLGREGRSLAKSSLAAERRAAPEANSLKKRIIEGIKSHLENEGHLDISELLSKGQNRYRQYHKLQENVYPYIKKTGIPLTGLAAFGMGYNKLKKEF